MSIRENLISVTERLKALPDYRPDIKLIAVSKTKPAEDMLAAFDAGQRLFGENKIQEARDKKPFLPAEASLHLIGTIQTNKIKYCPAVFDTIHSVSSAQVLTEIEKQYAKHGKTADVLIQMNLCDEDTKSGLTADDELFRLIEQFKESHTVKLTGLMTIPDPELNEADTARVFRRLFELRYRCQQKFGLVNTFTELSMGMSGDWHIAVAEGATYIRIGSAIFGARNYAV